MSVAPVSEPSGSESGTVLVSGAGGFTGAYVKPALTRAGYVHVGLGAVQGERVDVVADLTEREALVAALRSVAPRYVIHLAGIAFVGHADAEHFYRVNTIGAINLLEACTALAHPPEKVILASSANVYGIPASDERLSEGVCPAPVNHYAASKLAMECLARTWFDRLCILIARPFNYTGVGQDPRFVVPKIVKHFRERRAVLELGDTSVVRDFSDVRDVAEIYVRLLAAQAAGEVVNICSGRGIALTSVLEYLADESGHLPRVEVSKGLLRSAEIPRLVGSPVKLESRLEKVPARSFEETLSWMLHGG